VGSDHRRLGGKTVLDEGDQAELRRVLEEWSSAGELADELRWLHGALDGERLQWEAHLQGRSSLGSPGLGEACRTPFRRVFAFPSDRAVPRRSASLRADVVQAGVVFGVAILCDEATLS
jgi:hypothetical protein